MRPAHLIPAFLLAAATAPALAQQQPVTLRVAARLGQTMRFRTDIETWLNIPQLAAAGADTTRPTMAISLFITRTVAATRGDTAVFRDVVDSATAATPAIGGLSPADAAAAASSMRGMVMLSAVDGRGILLDYAAGTERTNPLEPPAQAMLPQAGLLRAVFAFPAAPVRPGESWSETLSGGDRDGSLTLSATFTLERTLRQGSSTVAVIGMAGQIGGGGPSGALAARVTGRIEYDMTESQPVRFVTDMVGQLATSSGSVPVRIRRTVTRL
jgi:hypothetical protein